MNQKTRDFDRSGNRRSTIRIQGLLSVLLLLGIGCGESSDRSPPPAERTRQPQSATAEGAPDPAPPPTATTSSDPIDQLEEGHLYRRALEALDEGDDARAEEIRRRLASHPQYAVLAEAIVATALAKQGSHAEALRVAEQISTVPVMRAEAFMIAGEVFRAQGRWSEAIGAFRSALDIHPQHRRAHRWLGALYHDTGAMQLAISHLRNAADLDPSDYRVLRLAGLINYEYQNFEEAVRDYRRALERSPPQQMEIEIRLELADSLRELRQSDTALAILEPCRKSADVLAMRAACHEAGGDLQLALDAAQRAVELAPRHPQANFILGRIYLSERAWEKALPHLRTAVEMSPTDHEPRFLLGRALLQTGDAEEGQEQLERSTELKELFLEMAELHIRAIEHPDDASLRVQLGKLAEQLGRPSLALTWYRAALGLQPADAEAAQAIERLQAGLQAESSP